MASLTPMPSLLDTSCWKVEVVNGDLGLLRFSLVSMLLII